MHAIEEGELSWHDRAPLMQRRMFHTHAVVFREHRHPIDQANKVTHSEKKFICKFHCACNRHQGTDNHTHLVTDITHTHDSGRRK